MKENEDTKKRTRQKQISDRFITRPVDFLVKHNITPNIISYIGFIFSSVASFLIALCGLYFSIWLSWIIPAIMGIAGAMDLFDGEVARRTGNETQSGAFLDSNLDRLSDAIFVICIIYGGLVNFLLGYVILFLVLMISYTRSRAENEGVNMKGIGFMERAERLLFLIFALIAELIFYFASSLILDEPFTIFIPFITRIPVTPIFLISIILYTFTLLYTLLQRVSHTFRRLKKLDNINEQI
ncbi:MAG: CDP-alcohol phosphatidyltransferase family protein [Candidatus Heimdallarchaeota archaeon]